MTLSEIIYKLRKKSGLSQEQLAEKLNVSRQAISKWESGVSLPESEKMIALSDFFGVSLDYLMKEDAKEPEEERELLSKQSSGRAGFVIGLIATVGGVVALIVWGILTVFDTAASGQIGESSRIEIDGNALLLILCIVLIVVGAVLLWKGNKRK